MQNLKYFTWSIGFTVFGLIGGYLVGGWSAVFIVAVLAVLETSLSFDNAVVNATVLRHMDEKWRQRFLLWGILIAVFGMRIVFPLAIVGVVANLGPVAVVDLALFNPDEYARILTSAHHEIAAFGGAFLIVMAVTWLLLLGVRESARANNIMVAIKLLVLGLFVVVGAQHTQRIGILVHEGDEAVGQLLDRFPILDGALDDLVVDVGDVAHIGQVIAAETQPAGHQVEGNHAAAVADVAVVVHGHAAHVHAHLVAIQRLEDFFALGERVVDRQHFIFP